MMKRLLVAGSTGYLGKIIIKGLVEINIRPVALAPSSAKLGDFH